MRKGLTQKTLPGFNGILNTTITMWIKKKKPQNLKDCIICHRGPTM